MDGVLVDPNAYHKALQKTVSLVGQALGLPGWVLKTEDIAAFEGAGVSSEWDSAAICAAISLANVWKVDPNRRLTYELLANPPSALRLSPPDFQAFAVLLNRADLRNLRPLARASRLLLEEDVSFTPEQRRELQVILTTARQIDGSLTHRLFQELILGSRVFADVYGLKPFLDYESFLLAYDRPTLSEDEHQGLLAWGQENRSRMVIFTSRPSLAPQGFFGVPEAEMGAQLAGLREAPIAGLGGLSWLSQRLNQDAETFLKPDPIHALVALNLALGGETGESLECSAALALQGVSNGYWEMLEGAQVFVFEDTTGGLASVAAAQKLLANIGIKIETHSYGVAGNELKRRALQLWGAEVFPNLASALRKAGVIV
jgi:hypothetical protein